MILQQEILSPNLYKVISFSFDSQSIKGSIKNTIKYAITFPFKLALDDVLPSLKRCEEKAGM